MADEKILKSIYALAREECMKNHNGVCLETNDHCRLDIENCDYFLENVLPVGWDMEDLEAYAAWYGADDENDDIQD